MEGWAGQRLPTKLKLLKNKMKEWAKEYFGDLMLQRPKILAEIQALDRKEESDNLTLEEEKEKATSKRRVP